MRTHARSRQDSAKPGPQHTTTPTPPKALSAPAPQTRHTQAAAPAHERNRLITHHRILITGATGFIGSRVTSLLSGAPPGPSTAALRLLVHHRGLPAHLTDHPAVETVHAGLTRPSSLHGICEGIDTLLHLGSCITGTAQQCHAVNDLGTGALLAEAARAGVKQIVRLGTTAVYREGPYRRAAEDEPIPGPASATSTTRLAGEQRVLDAGGVVIRPHLVYGPQDRWFIPTVARLLTAVPHWVDEGRALLSLIHVDDLARCLAALAIHPSPPGVLHAAHPQPVTARTLLTTVADGLQLPRPQGHIPLTEALTLLGNKPETATLQRHLTNMNTDHWYDSTRLWQHLRLTPGPPFTQQFPQSLPWYHNHLTPTT